MKVCPECGGCGVATRPSRWESGYPEEFTCPTCNGTGEVPDTKESGETDHRTICRCVCMAAAVGAVEVGDYEMAKGLQNCAALIERDGTTLTIANTTNANLHDYIDTQRKALLELVEAVKQHPQVMRHDFTKHALTRAEQVLGGTDG